MRFKTKSHVYSHETDDIVCHRLLRVKKERLLVVDRLSCLPCLLRDQEQQKCFILLDYVISLEKSILT